MYKGNSQNMQRRADALVPKNLMAGTEAQSDHDRRRNLVRAFQAKEMECIACDNKEEKHRLGQEIQELQRQIRAIPKLKRPPDFASNFVQAARELLPKADFRNLCNRAQRLCDEAAREGSKAA